MPQVYQTRDKHGRPHPLYRFRYTDRNGRRRAGTGTPDESETKDLAAKVQAEERSIRRGWIVAPATYQAPVIEVVKEYLAWGATAGGKGGRPWTQEHQEKKTRHLTWWVSRLRPTTMADFSGCLPRVEAEARALAQRWTAATVRTYESDLWAFFLWAVRRGYLGSDPLAGMRRHPPVGKAVRRALTPEEFIAVCKKAPAWRRILYETAVGTGLRANELASLCISDLDVAGQRLRLDEEWTKNRKGGWQPISRGLARKLQALAAGREPTAPLLRTQSHQSRALRADCRAAGVDPDVPGKVDFHSLRVTYTTWVIEAGATVKEAMELVRHADPRLTMQVYARSRPAAVSKLAESVGRMTSAKKRAKK